MKHSRLVISIGVILSTSMLLNFLPHQSYRKGLEIERKVQAAPPSQMTNITETVTFTNVVTEVFDIVPTHTLSPTIGFWRMGAGASIGDFNNDGWQDLFFLGGDFRPDALFINNQDGTFSNQATEWGIDATHIGFGTAVGDYNNDGWLDIFVTSLGENGVVEPGHNKLYHNNGNGSFTDMADSAGIKETNSSPSYVTDATFGDYDLDGDLDLFVSAWNRIWENEDNRLYQNNGDGTFVDVTQTAGIHNNVVQGLAPCFQDMNGDLYPELLIAGDFGTSRYYVNNRDGTFSDQTATSGTDIFAYGMGSAVQDFNGDGRFDWFITSIFEPDESGQYPDYNKLYLNQGMDRFTEVARSAGVENGFWGWGAIGVDINHDTWIDLLMTNGTFLDRFENRPSAAWLNNGNETFTNIAGESGFHHTGQGRSILHFDYDQDGDQDIVITASGEPLTLFNASLDENDTNWLNIQLDTHHIQNLAPNGVGTVIRIKFAEKERINTINGCSSYLGSSELSAHFGLGSAALIDEVRIEWANGLVTTMREVEANQHLVIAPSFHYFPLVGLSEAIEAASFSTQQKQEIKYE